MPFRYTEAMVEPPEYKSRKTPEELEREQNYLEDLAYDEYVDQMLEDKE